MNAIESWPVQLYLFIFAIMTVFTIVNKDEEILVFSLQK